MDPTTSNAEPPPLMTADEFLKLYGDQSGFELVKGRVLRCPEYAIFDTAPVLPLMTADEFDKLHGDESDVELIKGRVERHPMPGARHGRVCNRVNFYLALYEMEHDDVGRTVGNDTLIRTRTNPDSSRGADVCFITYKSLPKDQPLPVGSLKIAPELVIEVRSPTDRMGNIHIKLGEYFNAGVTVVVLLDPAIEAATIYRETEDIPQRFSNGDELTLPDVLPGFAVPVRKFFE